MPQTEIEQLFDAKTDAYTEEHSVFFREWPVYEA